MLACKICFTFTFVFAYSEHVCTSRSNVDDVTSLLQTNVEVKPAHAKDVHSHLAEGVAKKREHPNEENEEASAKAVPKEHKEHVKAAFSKTKKPSIPLKDQKTFKHKPAIGLLSRRPSYLCEFLASMLGMTLYVFIGCGTAMVLKDTGAKMFHVSLVFGFTMAALTYALWQYMVPLNFAAVFAFWCLGKVELLDLIVMLAGQLVGSVCGSMLTMLVIPEEQDMTRIASTGAGGLGGNAVSSGFNSMQAFFGEALCSLILIYITFEVAVNMDTVGARTLWCLNLGIAYFLVHSVMIPIDGCGINPGRTFGPHIVKKKFRPGDNDSEETKQQWIFWAGPLLGAAMASQIYAFMHQS
jgi:glycerol uptake facilitator-like aquaporin